MNLFVSEFVVAIVMTEALRVERVHGLGRFALEIDLVVLLVLEAMIVVVLLSLEHGRVVGRLDTPPLVLGRRSGRAARRLPFAFAPRLARRQDLGAVGVGACLRARFGDRARLGFERRATQRGARTHALLERRHQRRRVEDRVVAAGANADQQREGEVLQRRAAEGEQRDERDRRRSRAC